MTIAAWTWMIYLATHNNAAEAGQESVARMRQAQLGDHVRVLMQQSIPAGTTRHILGPAEQTQDLGRIDSGSPEALLDFIRWAAQTAPAARYALVLWSHGSGWEPKEMERLAQQQPPPLVPVTAGELNQRGADDEGRQVFFSSTMRQLLNQPTPTERAIAFDDGSGHSLDTIELGQVVAQARQVLGQPLDLLGMNACQMSNTEITYQVRDHAQVYVASQEDMPVQSWPYDDILTRLGAAPDMDPAALGKLIVERYCAAFRASTLPWGQFGLPKGVTLAAVRPANAGQLSDAARALSDGLQADLNGQLQAVWDAQRAAHAFKFRLYDLASFCRTLGTHPAAAPATKVAAQQVLTVLADPAFLLAEEHTAQDYDDVGGLTTYLMAPTPGKTISPYYAETDYAKATNWGIFLADYHTAVQNTTAG